MLKRAHTHSHYFYVMATFLWGYFVTKCGFIVRSGINNISHSKLPSESFQWVSCTVLTKLLSSVALLNSQNLIICIWWYIIWFPLSGMGHRQSFRDITENNFRSKCTASWGSNGSWLHNCNYPQKKQPCLFQRQGLREARLARTTEPPVRSGIYIRINTVCGWNLCNRVWPF